MTIIIWILYPVIEALVQRFTYFKRPSQIIRPNYLMLFLIRGMASILHGVLMDVQVTPWWDYPALLCFQVGVFWLLFDPLLNSLRDKPLDYEGKNSGWLKFVPYWLQASISVVLIIVGLYWSYFKI